MANLEVPDLSRRNATRIKFALVANTQSSSSPLDGAEQTSELPGARWYATITWLNLAEADARIVKAWLAKLRGRAGRFNLGDLSHKAPSGTAAGAGKVNGANQSGASLVTDGWTANQAKLFAPGDYIGVNGELKMITDVPSSNSSGQATLTFEPPLRSAPADNAVITTTLPTAVFRLADDQQDQMDIDPDRHPTVVINAVEVF